MLKATPINIYPLTRLLYSMPAVSIIVPSNALAHNGTGSLHLPTFTVYFLRAIWKHK